MPQRPQEVVEQGEVAVRARSRKTTSIWERAGKQAMGAAAGSAASIAAAAMLGKKSRAHPMRSAATSAAGAIATERSEEHTSELQSLMRISYAVFCLQKQKLNNQLLFITI